MAYSRAFAVACTLPLLALVFSSFCLNASADLVVPEAASSALAAAASGELAQLDASHALSDDAATRRILDDDDDDDDEDKKDKKKKDKKAKKDKKSKKSPTPSPSTPAPTTPTAPTKTGGKKGKTPPTPATPGTPKTPAAPGKPTIKLTSGDQKVISSLEAAAIDVDSAKAKLSVKTYVKSLTDTAAALRNSAILIRTGQRTLVAGQIDNAIATINGVSVMLPAAGADKKLLASALTKAQAAKAAWKA
ncbi:hypothetical protein CLOM_g20828 [Closterium sp. NIES-68]|nr:hypothetical protein CLOM_g20826 [Closterium sp. NIES-68]GJP36303.1 hypothetical protein CLOM_g20828 [Closterium sp. NIES-68]GJP69894.1 hypothetical protein CLOP_g896 [Closterium sp. NIES-67]